LYGDENIKACEISCFAA